MRAKPKFLTAASLALLLGATAASAEPAASDAELQSRVEKLRQELAQERQALETQRAEQARAGQAQSERAQLEQRLQALQRQLQALESQRATAAAAAGSPDSDVAPTGAADGLDAQSEQLERLREQAAAAAEQLRVVVQELPADERAERLSELERQLAKPEAAPEAVVGLVELLDESFAVASSVRLEAKEIWTALGQREAVDLLRVGDVGFAYSTQAGGRLGLAVKSARDASGFRWTEELDPKTRAALQQAFDDVRSGRNPVRVPLDVTGQLRASDLQTEQSLVESIQSGGLVMYPLIGVAALALLLILERALVLFGMNRSSTQLGQQVLAASTKRRFEQAQKQCEQARGTVARTLAAVLARRDRGRGAMEDGVQTQLLAELPKLQRFIGGIAVLAAVAPLLGLLGTVTGIIRTFTVIKSFGNANPGLMAGGISEALTTTAAGLIVAIPLLLAHSLLKGRADGIVSEAERLAAELLGCFDYATEERASEAESSGAIAGEGA